VGDPLYRPFGRDPQSQHNLLATNQSPLLEWSHLRAINMNAASGVNADNLIGFLDKLPLRAHSAVLEEKLAELLLGQNRIDQALDAYRRVLNLTPSPQQAVRVEMELARFLAVQEKPEQAYLVYQEFLKNHPDFPEPILVYQKLYDLARSLGRKTDAEAHLREIDRLKSPLPPQTNSISSKS
jgi:tetratricopeptide (TPR) repeat protein